VVVVVVVWELGDAWSFDHAPRSSGRLLSLVRYQPCLVRSLPSPPLLPFLQS
jgi:hypothetical protein